MPDLACVEVVWVNLNPVVGSEQAGHRPALVIASDDYLASVPNIVVVLPVTTRDRALPNHVRLSGDVGIEQTSFAMTEQPRTIDRRRITKRVGTVDDATMIDVRRWLADFLDIGH